MKGTKIPNGKRAVAYILALTMLFTMCISWPAAAAEGDVHEETLYPMDNGWTQANAPDSTRDSSAYLLISGIGPGGAAATRRHAYLKFDLANLNYSEITSAELYWYTNVFSNRTTRVTSVYALTEQESLAWSGDSITWGNAPDYGVANADYDGVTPIGTLSQEYSAEPAWGSVDLTEYFQTVEPDRFEISFAMMLDTGASYISSLTTGDGNMPYLKITYKEGSGQSAIPRSDIRIKTLDENNTPLVPEVLVPNMVTGRTYRYADAIEQILVVDSELYQFNIEESVLSVNIQDGAEIILKYNKLVADENGFLTARVPAVDSANTSNIEPAIVQSNNPTILTSSDSGNALTKADRSAFLKFDLSKLNVGIVSSAALNVYMTSSTNAGARTVSAYRTSDEWSSETLVWDNAPDATSDVLDENTFSNGETGWLSFDVFQNLSAVSNEDTTVSFRLDTDTGANYFSSHFNNEGYHPYLELTFKPFSGSSEGQRNVTVRKVDENAADIVTPETIQNITIGQTYFYSQPIDELIEAGGVFYQYDKSRSIVSVQVTSDGDNEILLAYTSLPDGTISSATIRTVTSDGTPLESDYTEDMLWSGDTYFYNTAPVWTREENEILYGYSDSFSNRRITVSSDKSENVITLLYKPVTVNPTGELKTANAPILDSGWAIQSSPGLAMGFDDSIDVSSSSLPTWSTSTASAASATRVGFMKFDLANIAYERIKSAKLVLTVNSASNNGTRVLYAYPISSAWDSTSVTWNSAPVFAGERPAAAAGQIELARMTTAGSAQIDVTSFMENLVGGETDVSFMLEVDTAAVNLATTGEGTAPYLELEYYEGAPTTAKKGEVVLHRHDVWGNELSDPVTLCNEVAGRVYSYSEKIPAMIKTDQGNVYSYDEDASILSLTVEADTQNEIVLVYKQVPIYPGEAATVTVVADDNAFVVENAASTVQNNESLIQLTGIEGSGKARTNRDGLVKFDTSFIDAAEIESAVFSFVVTSSTNTGPRTITLYACDSNWTSKTACWNNAPVCDTALPLGSVEIQQSATGLYSVDLTDYFNSIKDNIPDSISFRMKTNTAVTEISPVAAGAANAMKLNISYTAAGEAVEKQFRDVRIVLIDTEDGIIEEKTQQGIVGREFSVVDTVTEQFTKNEFVYLYQPQNSVTAIIVSENTAENEIRLIYKAYNASQFYTDNILVSENAWVNESDPNLRTSNGDGLLVSSTAGKDPALANRDILLKFDMDYINFSEIVSAKLTFFVDSATNSAVRATQAYPVSSDWVQNDVSWNNAPTYKLADMMGSVSFSGGVSDWYQIDITEYMAANVTNETGDFSIRLKVDTACNYIAPLEDGEGTAPRLVVSYLDDGSVPRRDVTLSITDPDGVKLQDDSIYAEDLPVGREFSFNGAPDTFRQYGGETYVYMENLSTTSIVIGNTNNVLTLVYAKERSGLELKAEFEASQNAYTDENNPTSVQDRSSYLLVTKAAGASPALSTRDTFLKFSLVQIAFSEISSAKLKFYVNRTGNNTDRTVYASLTDAGWDADTLTWSNAPAKNDAVGSVTFAHNATGWYEIDVTDALSEIANDTVDVSLCLTTDTASCYITSIEVNDGLAPKLEVTYRNDGTAPVRERRDVHLSIEDADGTPLSQKTLLEESVVVGSTYVYKLQPELYYQSADGTNYVYSAEKSDLSVRVSADGDNTVKIVYERTEYSGNIISKSALASDNAYTNSAQTSTPQSTASYLLTSGMEGSMGANSTRDTYIKFSLPSDEYRYSKIISAKLRFYVQQATNETTRTTDIYLIEDNTWSGQTLTYDNAPEFGSSGYLASLSFANGTTGWKEIDISEALATIDYTDTLSFALRTNTGANYWGSITSGQAAQLELVYVEGDPVYYERAAVTVKTVDDTGELLKDSVTIPKIAIGTSYRYTSTPDASITINDRIYTYKPELSTLSVEVAEDESQNNILLVYTPVSPDDIFSGYEISPEGAYCWFADDRALHYKNDAGTIDMTYVGYIDVHGSIKATQYNHLTGEVSETLVRSNFQPDDHDAPAFLVLPDEHVLIIYSRHTDESAFYYRVSQKPGDITTLGAEKKLLTSAATTYPNPFILSDDLNHVYLCWRGTNWHPTMAQLNMPNAENDYTFAFTWGPRQIVSSSAQSSGCRPYAKYVSNGKDTIHLTYSSTHPDNINPVALYYNAIQITDFTEGNVQVAVKGALGDILTTALPFRITNNETDPSFVVDDRSTSLRGWVWQIELDSSENPVIAMVRISSDKTLHTYYYAKWDPVGGEWVKTKLDDAGGAFHLSSSEQCYSGGISLDSETPNVIYGSIPVEGIFGTVYEIIKYTMSDDGRQILAREPITKNSVKNNIRPFSIPGTHEGDMFDLIWMNGDYWFWIVNKTYPNGFPTAVHTNFDMEHEEFDGNNNLAAFSPGGLQTVRLDENLVTGDSFTVSAFVDFSKTSNWGGTPINLAGGKLKYEVNTSSYIPTLTIGGSSYNSSNLWSNSDWNKNHSGTTDGSTGTTNPGKTHLAISYDAHTGIAKTYINGLVDQFIELDPGVLDLSGENLIGQADAAVSGFRIYNDVLTCVQLKQLMEFAEEEPTEESISASLSATMNAEATAVTIRVTNSGSALNATVYVAVYNANNELAYVQKNSLAVDAGEEELLPLTLKEALLAGDTLRVFLWDNRMRAVTTAVHLR
ncbi:MAG: DNRLRE domain-containing protein [Clostridia bacterium]|nr:DNRLRE domain-containing protein [Clostridia bacterium]